MSPNVIDIIPALLREAAHGRADLVGRVIDSLTETELFAVNHRVAVVHAHAEGEQVVAAFIARRLNAMPRVDA